MLADEEEGWEWDESVRAAVSFIDEAAAAALRETGRGGSVRARISASAQLYRQSVHILAGGAPRGTAPRIEHDRRGGARIELTAELDEGAALRRRIASRDLAGLVASAPPGELGREIARGLSRRLECPAAPEGTVAAVFAAGACGPLLHEIGHFFEESRAADRRPAARAGLPAIGERVAGAYVTIVDDPGASAGRGSYRIDDSGEGARPATLVREGILVGRLERGAGSRGLPPAAGAPGHARRGSYREPPLARMACTFMAAGREDPAEIVRSTKRGILVRSLRGGRADPFTGRIVLLVEDGLLIEAGRTTRPLVPCILTGSVAGILGAIDAVGRDLLFDGGAGDCAKEGQPLPVTVGMPTVRVGAIGVAAPGSWV